MTTKHLIAGILLVASLGACSSSSSRPSNAGYDGPSAGGASSGGGQSSGGGGDPIVALSCQRSLMDCVATRASGRTTFTEGWKANGASQPAASTQFYDDNGDCWTAVVFDTPGTPFVKAYRC